MNCTTPRRSALLVMHPDPLLRAGLVAALCGHRAFETLDYGDEDILQRRRDIDVVITDYDSAVRLARRAHPASDRLPGARILTFTTNDREADIRDAIEAGVHGYVLLGDPIEELFHGAQSAANGLRYVSTCAARRMADSLAHSSLTPREIEVLRLVAGGESNKTVARSLEIKVGTVKCHMTAIMSKLGAHSRTEAASIAATRGLVDRASRPGRAPVG